ncbi:Fe-S osidoreductase [Ignicoccus pacificus DSM 13166]|uniref:Fe-S osidoreductase n=1 Tax=Ignicoccus pacificus DSM 13166 TaxID=940294 RepID=A0A977PKN3_9CREN|nr:Fe-S osidoreductase [Ignicoccus pacificus DSM 13166]
MKNRLKSIIWILTGACNLNCLHCYAKRFLSWQPEVSEDEVRRVLSEALELGLEWVNFSGGELLLYKPWSLRVLAWLSEEGVDSSLVTNAMFIDNEKASYISKNNIHVYVSIDGTKETHEKHRGPGTFDAVIRGIEKLKAHNASFTTIMAVSRLNYHVVKDFVRLSKELGASSVAIIPVMPFGNALVNEVWVRSREYMKALLDFVEALDEYEISGNTWCTPWSKYFFKSKRLHAGNCRFTEGIDIGPDGSVLLCDVLDIKLGNIREKNLKEVITEVNNNELVKKLREVPTTRPCRSCVFRELCLGGCYARALQRWGTLEGDPLCPLVSLSRFRES